MLVGRHFEGATRFLDMNAHHADVTHINVWLNDFFSPSRTVAFSENGCANLIGDNTALFALQMAYILHMEGGRKSATRKIHVFYVVPDSNVNQLAVKARRRLSILDSARRTRTPSQSQAASSVSAPLRKNSVAAQSYSIGSRVGSRRSSVVGAQSALPKAGRRRTSTADNALLYSVESVNPPGSAREFQQALGPGTPLVNSSGRQTVPVPQLLRPPNNPNQNASANVSRRNSLSSGARKLNAIPLSLSTSQLKVLDQFKKRQEVFSCKTVAQLITYTKDHFN